MASVCPGQRVVGPGGRGQELRLETWVRDGLWTRTKAVDVDAGFRLSALLPITSGP